MTSLFALVPSGSDSVELPVLEAAVFDGDVLIDCLTDEELFWLRQGESSSDPAMDEPYLATLDDRARRVATDSGLRSLIAKGMVDIDPDEPGHLDFIGAYAVLAELRTSASVVTRLRLDVAGEDSIRYSFSLISESLVLTEEVADGGFHDFILQSPASAAVALASIFDRHGSAGGRSHPTERAVTRDDLRPHPDLLAESALHTVLLRTSHTEGGAPGLDLAVTAHGTREGVWVSWTVQGSRPHVRARLGRADLEAIAFDLIAGEPPSL